MTSGPFPFAVQAWRRCRAEYALHLEAAVQAAEIACRGYLLNDRGREAGISPDSLFMGTAARAYAYASPELVDWWETHPRVPFATFERHWWQGDEA